MGSATGRRKTGALSVDHAVDHLGTVVHAEQTNDNDADAIAENSKRDHESYEHQSPPRTVQKQAAATRLVMKSTRLDRMPLHSCATSMIIPGNANTMLSRRIGVPETWKKKSAASAEATWDAVSSETTTSVGNGTKKIKKANGNVQASTHPLPKNRNPQDATKQT